MALAHNTAETDCNQKDVCFKFSFWAAFIVGTEMHFASSGSVTSCVKSNCLVKERVYRIYIENILCLCQCAAKPNGFCLFLCLCVNLLYQRVHWLKVKLFYNQRLQIIFEYTCHLNNEPQFWI